MRALKYTPKTTDTADIAIPAITIGNMKKESDRLGYMDGFSFQLILKRKAEYKKSGERD